MTAIRFIDAALEYYQHGFNVIPVDCQKKKPPERFTWKQFQNRRITEKQVRDAFLRYNTGIAVIMGQVSGGLYCRDFDRPGDYENWSSTYPELSDRQPTVSTKRGAHVYFHSDTPIQTIDPDNGTGELRGDGGFICILPPSIHPSGHPYTWLRPLGDAVPTLNPFEVGLVPQDWTERTEQTELTEIQSNRDTEAVGVGGGVLSVLSVLSVKSAQALARTAVPSTGSRNHHHLFELAREVKAYELANRGTLTPEMLRQIHNEWHRLSLEFLKPSQDREAYFFEFLDAYHSVKYPKGQGPFAQALAAARIKAPPPVAMQFESQSVRLLVGLCQELQRLAGDKPFYLSCRSVALALHLDTHQTAANYLRGLVRLHILKVVSAGGPKADAALVNKATRYRYLPEVM